jgi:hypothetical protein
LPFQQQSLAAGALETRTCGMKLLCGMSLDRRFKSFQQGMMI